MSESVPQQVNTDISYSCKYQSLISNIHEGDITEESTGREFPSNSIPPLWQWFRGVQANESQNA